MPVNPALLLGFLAVSVVFSAIPGPSVLLETNRAITHGRRSAAWIMLGNIIGGLLLLALVLAGLGTIVATSARLFLALKLVGAAYLLWLGIQSIRASRSDTAPSPTAVVGGAVGGPLGSIRQGLLVGLSNPKSIVVMMAMLPQFVDSTLPHPVLQMALIGLAGALTQAVVETVWIVAAGLLRAWFQRRPQRMQRLRATGGVAMIGLSGKLVLGR